MGNPTGKRTVSWRLRPAVLALAGAFPLLALAAPAARVEFVSGQQATAALAGAGARPVVRGTELVEGETVLTHEARVQLRFSDGSFVSLDPGSEFRIDQYRYNGASDGQEKGFFSLLRGALRTVTGAIGKGNRRAYQLSTTVATIGIRGTAYHVRVVDGENGQTVIGQVGDGGINTCTTKGCQGFYAGDTFIVRGPDSKPQKLGGLPQFNPLPDTRYQYRAGDTINGSGGSASFVQPFTGTQALSIGLYDGDMGSQTFPSPQPALVSFDSTGAVTQFSTGSSPTSFGSPVIGADGRQMTANDGILAWGAVNSSSSGEFSHYVVGTPLVASAMGRTVAQYSLIGGFVTWNASSNNALGGSTAYTAITSSGALVVDFGAGTVALSSLKVPLPGQVLTLGTGSPISLTTGATGTTFVGSVNCTSTYASCSGILGGIVAGAKGQRVGIVVSGSTDTPIGTAYWEGSAGYQYAGTVTSVQVAAAQAAAAREARAAAASAQLAQSFVLPRR